MLSHELTRQLKDAGYPLKPYPEWAAAKDGPLAPEFISPTLSELIEACADFEALTKEHSQAGDEWVASSFHRTRHGRGSTPEEAVGRLWLALHATA